MKLNIQSKFDNRKVHSFHFSPKYKLTFNKNRLLRLECSQSKLVFCEKWPFRATKILI